MCCGREEVAARPSNVAAPFEFQTSRQSAARTVGQKWFHCSLLHTLKVRCSLLALRPTVCCCSPCFSHHPHPPDYSRSALPASIYAHCFNADWTFKAALTFLVSSWSSSSGSSIKIKTEKICNLASYFFSALLICCSLNYYFSEYWTHHG